MPHIRAADAASFVLPGVTFTGLASPSRGATETAVWQVAIAPGTPGMPHRLTREEIIIALSGQATATIGGQTHHMQPGDALVIPANTDFSLANPHAMPFNAVAVLPVGGMAQIGVDPAFTPPWAA